MKPYVGAAVVYTTSPGQVAQPAIITRAEYVSGSSWGEDSYEIDLHAHATNAGVAALSVVAVVAFTQSEPGTADAAGKWTWPEPQCGWRREA